MLLRSRGFLLRKSQGRNQSGVTELRAGDCYYGRAAVGGCYTEESIGGCYSDLRSRGFLLRSR